MPDIRDLEPGEGELVLFIRVPGVVDPDDGSLSDAGGLARTFVAIINEERKRNGGSHYVPIEPVFAAWSLDGDLASLMENPGAGE